MQVQHFNSHARVEQKEAARREDARELSSGSVSRGELRERNSLFSQVDLSSASVVLPPHLM
jgi:hypothetical protein